MCAAGPLVAEPLQERTKTLIIRCHDAAIATRDLLGLLQRKASDVADRADWFAPIASAPGLGTVFNEDQLVLVGDGLEFLHAARIAREMNGNDGLGLRRDLALHIGRVEV